MRRHLSKFLFRFRQKPMATFGDNLWRWKRCSIDLKTIFFSFRKETLKIWFVLLILSKKFSAHNPKTFPQHTYILYLMLKSKKSVFKISVFFKFNFVTCVSTSNASHDFIRFKICKFAFALNHLIEGATSLTFVLQIA